MYTDKFDAFVCQDDSITVDVDGFTATARIEYDETYNIDDDDCHNTDQTITGCNDKQFKELLSNRQAWFNDEWFYCGVVISVSRNGIKLTDWDALWGIEANYPTGNNDYLTEVANELLSDAIDNAKECLSMLCSPLCED